MQGFYDTHARRMVVMGVAPLGCAPYYLSHYRSWNGGCVEAINNMIFEFNTAMRFMVYELGQELPDANITFCDAFEGFMDIVKNHQSYGQLGTRYVYFSESSSKYIYFHEANYIMCRFSDSN